MELVKLIKHPSQRPTGDDPADEIVGGYEAAPARAGALIAPPVSAASLALGAVFGLAAAASGDHLGATVQGMLMQSDWATRLTAERPALQNAGAMPYQVHQPGKVKAARYGLTLLPEARTIVG